MFSNSTMNKLSIINGLISQIAMTFISNALTSVLSLLLSNIVHPQKDNEAVSVEIFSVMNYFNKKSFASISNLFIPTSILGALFIRLYGMKKVQIVTCLLQSICLILLSIINGLRQNIFYLTLCWLIFIFGIGAVSQISLRNAALHFRQYQGTIAMSLVIFGDLFITVVGWICQHYQFPTNNNRKIDDLITVFLLYLIPMWISLFITFYADFEKDPIDDTQQQQITLSEYIDELKSIYKYENLAQTMLIEFGITILSYFLVQIIFSYSDYFSETSNHCLHLNNYNNLQLIRNISWFGCIGFALLIDKGLSFKTSIRFINFAGLILGVLTIISSIIKEFLISDFLTYIQIIFIIQYIFICSFYSAILGKTLKIFTPAKMMEVTGYIGIAPAVVKIIRMLFEECFGLLLGNEIKQEINKHCDKIDNTKSYTTFGAWIYYHLKKSSIFYCCSGVISILLNIYAIYYIKFVPETEVPFDKASIKDLEQKPEDVYTSEIKFQTESKNEDDD